MSLLSLGIMSQPELAALKNPSMAGVLEAVVGPWGAILINLALVVSVIGAFKRSPALGKVTLASKSRRLHR